jgi:hypothetical protein
MNTPRQAALLHAAMYADDGYANDSFAFNEEEGFPAFAGGGKRAEKDCSAHATNPPDPPAPCKNLRNSK